MDNFALTALWAMVLLPELLLVTLVMARRNSLVCNARLSIIDDINWRDTEQVNTYQHIPSHYTMLFSPKWMTKWTVSSLKQAALDAAKRKIANDTINN